MNLDPKKWNFFTTLHKWVREWWDYTVGDIPAECVPCISTFYVTAFTLDQVNKS